MDLGHTLNSRMFDKGLNELVGGRTVPWQALRAFQEWSRNCYQICWKNNLLYGSIAAAPIFFKLILTSDAVNYEIQFECDNAMKTRFSSKDENHKC